MKCSKDSLHILVIALTKGDEGSDNVVSRRVAVIKGLVTEPMGQAIDAEGGLLNEEDTKDSGIDEATNPVIPQKSTGDGGNNKGHGDDALEVVLMLPDNNRILVQVGDIGTSDPPGVLLHDHPANAT